MPILSIGHKRDFICPEQDVRALASASRNGKAVVFDKQPLLEVYDEALKEIGRLAKETAFVYMI